MPFEVSWVLNNQLCVGSAPKRIEHLQSLRDQGVKSILNLCSNFDFDLPPETLQFFEWRNFPLPDHRSGRLPEFHELQTCLNLLNELMHYNPTYVHCLAGVERSPLVILAWLMQNKKLRLQQALDYLQQVHPGTCPLPEQLKVLELFFDACVA